ncbi:vWA domain-containing protein [Stenotrophomonas pigmentata]|uniref:vWA domain-containing protein n=1 Tax=Stenotrophomonas pigmentata TaxID=3055080 RepID=UPI0026ED208D|nr:hypothetical protein [Stenotrophomonas sp. 610A2]
MSFGSGHEAGGSAGAQESRCACLLLLDTSEAMGRQRIDMLNAGLMQFKQALYADPEAAKRVDIAIVTYGPVRTAIDFVAAESFYPPFLVSTAGAPLGAAIEQGLELIRQRKDAYTSRGLSYYRPWVFLISAGAPSDSVKHAAELVREGEANKDFQFFAVGMEGAEMDALRQISVRAPLTLKGLQFPELFSWLSRSMRAVVASAPGDTVPLSNPTSADGWAAR